MPGQAESFLLLFAAFGILAAAAGLPVAAVYVRHRPPSRRLFPPYRRWQAAWSGWGVIGGLAAIYVLPQFVASILESTGFYRGVYGADFPGLPSPDGQPTPDENVALTLRGIWTMVLSCPLVLWLILATRNAAAILPPVPSRAATADLRRTSVVAYLGWLILTPLTFAVYAGVGWLLWKLTGAEPERHPMTQLGPGASWLDWGLFGLNAVVVAAVIEEVFFRGTLLPWLLQRLPPGQRDTALIPPRRRSDLMVLIAFGLALSLRWDGLRKAIASGQPAEMWSALAPALFVLATVPIYLALPRWRAAGRFLRLRSERAGRAVIATAILFAAAHSSVWPSPVPLFVLGMGLGYLAVRTRGVAVPMLVHGLFNAVSVVYLMIGGTA